MLALARGPYNSVLGNGWKKSGQLETSLGLTDIDIALRVTGMRLVTRGSS